MAHVSEADGTLFGEEAGRNAGAGAVPTLGAFVAVHEDGVTACNGLRDCACDATGADAPLPCAVNLSL